MDSSSESWIFSMAGIVFKGVSDRIKRMEQLRGLYDSAFREWALEMGRFEEARKQDPQDRGVLEAKRRSEAAESAYRTTRDRLAEALVAGAGGVCNCH
jgi:hypothetical protein